MRGTRVGLVTTGVVALAVCLTLAACGGSSSSKKKSPSATISSVTPASGSDAGGTLVTIVTTNFSDDFTVNPPAVTFDGLPGTSPAGSGPDTVIVTTPAHAAGLVDVVVTAAVNGQTATDVGAYTYTAGPVNCTIVGVTPNNGLTTGGDAVSISGTDFEPGSTVTFGGSLATNINLVGTTIINCNTPMNAAGMVDVRVQSANRDCTLTNGFLYIAAPVNCSITSVVPGTGTTLGGDFVSIAGADFELASTVTFGGVLATGVMTIGTTIITCDTPAHAAGMVDVRVQSAGRDCTLTNGFQYIAAPINCMITSITPPNGPQGGGTAVTIVGVDFGPLPPDPTVTFAGLGAMIVSATDTQIVVMTPGQPASGPATVRITNSTTGFCEVIDGYFYDPPVGPACSITSITPNMGDAAGGDMVIIVGTNFDPFGTEVFFGTELGLFSVATATMITVTTPPALQVGLVDVLVVPQGFSTCTEVGGFDYTGCVVSSVLPTVGLVAGGTPVTVTGVGFNPTDSEVAFDGVPATVIMRDPTGSPIVCTTPAGSGPGIVDVTVTSIIDGTSCTLPGGFQYSGCIVNSILPGNGPKVGDTAITIDGSDFDVVPTTITFGPFFATNVTVLSTSQITCNTPPSLTDGFVDVVISHNTGKTCTILSAYVYDTPGAPVGCTITSITPANGPVNGGTAITIMGTGFEVGTPGVVIDLQPAVSVTRVSASEIRCTTPMGNLEGVVDLHVVQPSGGDCSSLGGFTYDPPAGCPTAGPCVATMISPTNAAVVGGGTGTISGSDFCPGMTTVTFLQAGSVDANITGATVNQITFDIPAAPDGVPGPAFVFITDPNGLCGPIMFTYN
ncbi:MAG: IPT/TIG domain-containing protein [Planctomycetota bacterium]|nr:IPT/TIG domain-containing protein [Planctomycetota bacterium]